MTQNGGQPSETHTYNHHHENTAVPLHDCRDIQALAARALNDSGIGPHLTPEDWQDFHQDLIYEILELGRRWNPELDHSPQNNKSPFTNYAYHQTRYYRTIDLLRKHNGRTQRPIILSLDAPTQLGGRPLGETLPASPDIPLPNRPPHPRRTTNPRHSPPIRSHTPTHPDPLAPIHPRTHPPRGSLKGTP